MSAEEAANNEIGQKPHAAVEIGRIIRGIYDALLKTALATAAGSGALALTALSMVSGAKQSPNILDLSYQLVSAGLLGMQWGCGGTALSYALTVVHRLAFAPGYLSDRRSDFIGSALSDLAALLLCASIVLTMPYYGIQGLGKFSSLARAVVVCDAQQSAPRPENVISDCKSEIAKAEESIKAWTAEDIAPKRLAEWLRHYAGYVVIGFLLFLMLSAFVSGSRRFPAELPSEQNPE